MPVLLPLLISLLSIVPIALTQAQGSTLPDVTIKTLEGQNISFTEVATSQEITIVSFWATWCAPCKRELDAIADVYDSWVDQYKVKLVAVSVDDARAAAKVKPMVAEKGWPFEIFIDTNQELMRALHFQTVPYTILVNRQGQIVYQHSGYLPGDEIELEEQIAALGQ